MERFTASGGDHGLDSPVPDEVAATRSHSSKTSKLGAFARGSAPMTPARRAATISSGVVTRNSGAQMTGSRIRRDQSLGRLMESLSPGARARSERIAGADARFVV